jgi:microcystin-dependent protein
LIRGADAAPEREECIVAESKDASVAPGSAVPRRSFLARVVALAGGAALLARFPRPASAATADADPWIGEIALVPYTFPPKGWAFCNGQILAISQNQALFSLLGTTFGGDGITTFALPDLRGRVPVHQGQGPGLSNHTLGEIGGAEAVALTTAQLPAHNHPAAGSSANGTSDSPVGGVPARSAAGTPGYAATPDSSLAAGAIGNTGGGQSHNNLPPYLTMSYIIALVGIYPSQN